MLSTDSLTRFWFVAEHGRGIGVTAYSVADARQQIENEELLQPMNLTGEVIENVDIRELDQEHIVPNIGPPSFRGIWYPNLTVLRS